MKTFIISTVTALVAAIVFTFGVTAPTPASAAGNTGCYVYAGGGGVQVVGSCQSGGYSYQIRTFCADNWHAGQGYYMGGNWTWPPHGSLAQCQTGYTPRLNQSYLLFR